MSTTSRPLARRALLAAAIALGTGAAALDTVPGGAAPALARDEAPAVARMDATTLAHRIREGSRARILDVRDSAAFAEFTLPGAERLAPGEVDSPAYAPGDTVIVLADDDSVADWVAARLGADTGVTPLALRGGVNAWITEVLAPRPPAVPASARALERHREAIALANWFGGLPAGIEVPATRDAGARVPAVRRDRRIFRGC